MEEFVGNVLGSKAKTYVAQGLQSIRARQALLNSLFVHKKLPLEGSYSLTHLLTHSPTHSLT